MSDSRKHTPRYKGGGMGKYGKRMANKRVRNYEGHLSDGMSYKRLFDSWNIYDYNFGYWDRSEYLKDKELSIRQKKAIKNKVVYMGSLPDSFYIPYVEEEYRIWMK